MIEEECRGRYRFRNKFVVSGGDFNDWVAGLERLLVESHYPSL